MANLTTYTTIVQAEVDDTSARAQTVIERAVKDSYQEILKHCGRFLVGTDTYSTTAVAGTQEYTPTVAYEYLRVLWHDSGDTDFSILRPISENEAIEKYYNADNGTPSMYYQNANNVILVVTPDNAGTLEVVLVPVQDDISASNTSLVPDRYTNVLILGAVSRFKMYEGVPEAVDYQAKYAASLQDMKKELGSRFDIIQPSFMGR